MNTQSNLEHNPRKCLPSNAKDVARMEAMYRTVCAVSEQAADALSSMMPLDGSAIMRLGPFAVMVGTDKPRFEGLAICPHCITRAAMLLRDLANTCDNLVKEAEKHSKP